MLSAPGALAAGSDPLTLLASVAATRDSNLFRLPPAADTEALLGSSARGDTVRQWSVGLDLDKSLGRQRFLSRITGSRIAYSRFDFLDYNAVDGRATWLWRLGNALDGELGATENRTQADFADLGTPQKNVRTQRTHFLRGAYEVVPGWRVTSGIRDTTTDTTQAATRSASLREEGAELGIGFASHAGNRLGVQLVRAEGKYAAPQIVQGVAVDNAYTQSSLNGTMDWRPTGQSRISAAAGLTERQQNELPERDFRGLTGNFVLSWNGTGRLGSSLALRREVGAYQDLVNNYTVNRSASLNPVYSLTGKLALRGRYEYRVRDYRGDPGIVILDAARRQDHYHIAGLTLDYDDQRLLQASIGLQRETRGSNQPGLDYRANQATLSLQLAF